MQKFNNHALPKSFYLFRILAILALGWLIYYQTFHAAFVFDDIEFITTNPFIKNFDAIQGFWDRGFPKTRLLILYSFILNYQIGHLDPFTYHLFNFTIHILSTLLVWKLASLIMNIIEPGKVQVLKDYWNRKKKGKKAEEVVVAGDYRTDPLRRNLPFIIALIFLVHPVETQAITYITQRFESVATFFYLAAVCSYLTARLATKTGPKIGFFVLSASSALLAIMSKEVSVTIPGVIFMAEFLLFNRTTGDANEKKNSSSTKTIFLAIGIAGAIFLVTYSLFIKNNLIGMFNARGLISESHDGDVMNTGNYLLTQLRVFLTFLRLLVFPINQNLEYDYPMSLSLFDPPLTFVGLIAILSFIFTILKLRKNFPLIAFGLSWVFVTFLANLAPRSNVIFEHKLYLISPGFFIAAIFGLNHVVKHRKIFMAIVIAIVLILSFSTFQRNKVWRSELALWEDIVKKSPNKQRVYANLGKVYLNEKMIDKAIVALNKAIEINPKDPKPVINRGSAYFEQRQFEKALADYGKAISLKNNDFASYLNRGLLLTQMGRKEEALSDFNKAVACDPQFQYGYIKRGVFLREMGKTQEALSDFDMAIRIAPFDVESRLERGILHFQAGRINLAEQDFNEAQKISPNNPLVYLNRGFFYFKTGKKDAALADFNTAIRIDPNNSEAYNKRGILAYTFGNKEQALEDFNHAVNLNPNNLSAVNNRSALSIEKAKTLSIK